MPDKPLPNPPVIPPLFDGGNARSPILYFDMVSNYGIHNGVANMTLETVVHVTDDTGQRRSSRVIVGHLRMSGFALDSLAKAVKGIELLAQPVEQGQPS